MKRYFCWLGWLVVLLARPLAAGTSLIYVLNNAETTVQVIDSATNKVVQVIKDIESPESADFSPDGGIAYIAGGGEDLLFVVDRKTGKHIKRIPLSGWPNQVAVTKNGKRVLVCINDVPGALDIIDTASLEKVKTIPTKDGLHDIYVTDDGKYAVANMEHAKAAIVIDLQSEVIAWEIPFNSKALPMAIESGRDGSANRILANLSGVSEFAVVDFALHKEVSRVKFPNEPNHYKDIPTGGIPSHGIGIPPDGKTVWVVSRPGNCVFVYSLPDFKLLGYAPLPEWKLPGQEPLPAMPHWITFSGDSKTAYVANVTVKSVSAIDVKTMKEVVRIPVGEMPKRMSTLTLP